MLKKLKNYKEEHSYFGAINSYVFYYSQINKKGIGRYQDTLSFSGWRVIAHDTSHKTLNNMTPNGFEVKYYEKISTKSHRIVYSLKKESSLHQILDFEIRFLASYYLF